MRFGNLPTPREPYQFTRFNGENSPSLSIQVQPFFLSKKYDVLKVLMLKTDFGPKIRVRPPGWNIQRPLFMSMRQNRPGGFQQSWKNSSLHTAQQNCVQSEDDKLHMVVLLAPISRDKFNPMSRMDFVRNLVLKEHAADWVL